jgi:hypothetical protein
MNEEALQHRQPAQTMIDTLAEPEFWYESFQNWQSEFLSIGVLLVLGIYLRERGSPASKPVAAPHVTTGHRTEDRVFVARGGPRKRSAKASITLGRACLVVGIGPEGPAFALSSRT